MPTLVPPPKPRFSGTLSRMASGAAAATFSGVSVPVPLSTTTSGLGRSVDSPTLRRQSSVLFRLPQCTTTTAARTSAGASPTAASTGVGLDVATVLRRGFIAPLRQGRRLVVLLGHYGRYLRPGHDVEDSAAQAADELAHSRRALVIGRYAARLEARAIPR